MLYYGSAWQVPLFVGCVIGLLAVTVLQAATVAPSVMVLSLALVPPLMPANGPGAIDYVLAVGLSVSAAGGVAYARGRLQGLQRKQFGLAVSCILVAVALVNFWLPLFSAGTPVAAYGILPASQVRAVPTTPGIAVDDVIYRRVFAAMHEGTPYYQAYRDAWIGQPAPSGVVGYRLPTLYWAWKLLPPDPFAIVYLYLALCSVGLVSAALIAGQLVGARFAPLAATAFAAYAMGVGFTLYVVYVDLPAMSLALAGVALFVRARISGDRRWLWAAVAVLTLAALTREILVYLVVLAALSALLEDKGARLKAAVPWLAGLGVFGGLYVAHALAVRPLLNTEAQPLAYLSGGPGFVWYALTEFSNAINGPGIVLAALFGLGVAGAVGSSRRAGRPFAAFATAALVLPLLAMLRIGNTALDLEGAQINYWGMLVVPLGLALWPAWALLLGRRAGSR